MLQFCLGAQITTLDHFVAHLWKILWPQSWYNSYKFIFDHSSFQNSSVISKQNKIKNKTQALLQLTLHTLTPQGLKRGWGEAWRWKQCTRTETMTNSNPQTNYLSETKLMSLWPCFYFGKHGIPGQEWDFPLTWGMGHSCWQLKEPPQLVLSHLGGWTLAWHDVATSLWFVQPALTRFIFI